MWKYVFLNNPIFLANFHKLFLDFGLTSGSRAVGRVTVTALSCLLVIEAYQRGGAPARRGKWMVLIGCLGRSLGDEKITCLEFDIFRISFWHDERFIIFPTLSLRDFTRGEHLSSEEERCPRIRLGRPLCLQASFLPQSPHPTMSVSMKILYHRAPAVAMIHCCWHSWDKK